MKRGLRMQSNKGKHSAFESALGCKAFVFCKVRTQELPLLALAEFGDYLEVFEGGGVAFDFAVGG